MCLCDTSVGVFLLAICMFAGTLFVDVLISPSSLFSASSVWPVSVYPPPTSVPSLNILLCFQHPHHLPLLCSSHPIYVGLTPSVVIFQTNLITESFQQRKLQTSTDDKSDPLFFLSPWGTLASFSEAKAKKRKGEWMQSDETESETPLSET